MLIIQLHQITHTLQTLFSGRALLPLLLLTLILILILTLIRRCPLLLPLPNLLLHKIRIRIPHQLLARQIRNALQHSNLGAALGHRLGNRVMANKLAGAIIRDPRAITQAREAHGVVAGDFNDVGAVGVEVVADVKGEGALFVGPFFFPAAAAWVAGFGGAVFPGFEEFEGVGEGLGDDDARVLFHAAVLVFADVVVSAHHLAHVDGHCNRGGGGDAPAVEHPFKGDFEVLDGGVGIDEDDEFVRVEEFEEDVGFDPGVVEAFHFAGLEEFVVVAMDLGWRAAGLELEL